MKYPYQELITVHLLFLAPPQPPPPLPTQTARKSRLRGTVCGQCEVKTAGIVCTQKLSHLNKCKQHCMAKVTLTVMDAGFVWLCHKAKIVCLKDQILLIAK